MSDRAARLRSPLLLALAALLAVESAGGLVIFCTRVLSGRAWGETVHVVAGAMMAAVYAAYQWRHLGRVRPLHLSLDYLMGFFAALFLVATLATGFALTVPWWRARGGPAAYAPSLSAAHNIGSMLVLTFVGAHLAAVLMRDRAVRLRG